MPVAFRFCALAQSWRLATALPALGALGTAWARCWAVLWRRRRTRRGRGVPRERETPGASRSRQALARREAQTRGTKSETETSQRPLYLSWVNL